MNSLQKVIWDFCFLFETIEALIGLILSAIFVLMAGCVLCVILLIILGIMRAISWIVYGDYATIEKKLGFED
jgi:hypothetical protein